MAGYILLAGHKRFAYPSATYLIHDGSMALIGDASKVKDHAAFNERYTQVVNRILFEKTTITQEELEKHERIEWYFMTDDLLKYNIVDEIITNM
jgi:ATP-dependent protease ClpP protease subunit